MKRLYTILVAAALIVTVSAPAVAHPWTLSDMQVEESGSSSYRIRGVIKSSTKYDYHGFIVLVRRGGEDGPTIRNVQNMCNMVDQCGTVVYSDSVYIPQSKHYVLTQHCATDGSHQLHPNDRFAQYVGNVCAGKLIDLNTKQLN